MSIQSTHVTAFKFRAWVLLEITLFTGPNDLLLGAPLPSDPSEPVSSIKTSLQLIDPVFGSSSYPLV